MKKYYLPIIVAALMGAAILLGFFQNQGKLFGSNSFSQTKSAGTADDKSLADYYQTAQSLSKTNNQQTEASFLAVGDIMLSRSVASTIKKSADPLLPFKNVKDLLASTNFNFGNLESPLSGKNDFEQTGSMTFNAPPAYTDGLSTYNFKILNLANNHALDQGITGINYTRQFLDSKNIMHIGTGTNLDEAWQGQVIDAGGIKIGFIGASYASANDGGKGKNNYVARIEDVDKLKTSIMILKTKADFIVVTMHAGTEYTRTANPAQIAFAHSAIDAGADMVIGAHPHWVQNIEKYNDKYIFYSLGNFIFDQMWSQDTKEGLTLKITLQSKKQSTNNNAATIDDLQGTKLGISLKQIELIPIIIDNFSTPRMANEKESADILNKINTKQIVLYP